MTHPIYLFCFLFMIVFRLQAQVDYKDLSLTYGPHEVGFKNVELIDSTRTYERIMAYSGSMFRPVSLSVWEPAVRTIASNELTIKDYLEVLKNEEEWPGLPFEYFFDWFYISPSPHNQQQASYTTKAIQPYQQKQTNLPIIIYSASYRASSTENFILCEYLASYGFKVIAIPSKGSDNLNFQGGTIKDATAQSRDVDFVIRKRNLLGFSEATKVILSGFSFGGISHILNGANNHMVDAILSLDGTIKYKPELLEETFDYTVKDFTIPFIHISQKDIPINILTAQGVDTTINDRFSFYDQITSQVKYQIKSRFLSHQYFASYGLLFNERDPQQDPDYTTIKESYEALLALSKSSLDLLHQYGATASWPADQYLKAIEESGIFELTDHQLNPTTTIDFIDFIALNRVNDFTDIQAVYDSVKVDDPSFYPKEGDLNTLALQLVFTKEGYQSGINLFQFALELYPQSANLYDSIAEGYRYNNEKELAIINFEKSLELYPGNSNATKRLAELKRE